MKVRRADISKEEFTELLWRSRLLTAEEVLALDQQWRQDALDPTDLGAFAHWLVVNQLATDFQVAMLLHGHADHLFLGPYKLLERIGRGTLAMVYQGVHRLGRLAALKVLPPSRAKDPATLARFLREARLAQGLDHVNVVHTLDFGEAGGLHYLVMEYLDGETLQQVLNRRGRLEVDEAVDIIAQVLQGMQHLHERGIVHRGLEPANLMLIKPADGLGPLVVKILDVSLGRSLLEEGPPEDGKAGKLTYEGLLLGAPGYLAPEQARDAHGADIRSDIYSVGCIFYHALAGQPPFKDSSPLRQIIRSATEMPQPLCEVNPQVPEALAMIVNWMMARDPAQRYATPERALGALRTFREGERAALLAPPAADCGDAAEPPPPIDAVAKAAGSEQMEEELVFESLPPPPGPVEQRPSGSRNLGLGRRDFLCLLLGAAGLLVAQAIGWLLGRLSR